MMGRLEANVQGGHPPVTSRGFKREVTNSRHGSDHQKHDSRAKGRGISLGEVPVCVQVDIQSGDVGPCCVRLHRLHAQNQGNHKV